MRVGKLLFLVSFFSFLLSVVDLEAVDDYYAVYKGTFKVDQVNMYGSNAKYKAYYIFRRSRESPTGYAIENIDGIDFENYQLTDLDEVPVKIVFFSQGRGSKYYFFPGPFINGRGVTPMYTTDYYMAGQSTDYINSLALFSGLMYGGNAVKQTDYTIISSSIVDKDADTEGLYNMFETVYRKKNRIKVNIAVDAKNVRATGNDNQVAAVSVKGNMKYDKALNKNLNMDDVESMHQAVARVCDYLESKGYASTW